MKKQTRVRITDAQDNRFGKVGTVIKTTYNKTWGCNLITVLADGEEWTWRYFAHQLERVA
jgi:hypothetical protein